MTTKDNTKQPEKSTYPVTSEEFVETILSEEVASPRYTELWHHYGKLMRRAVREGRTATPERMAKLYPIFREICDELDEMDAFYAECEEQDRRDEQRKAARRTARRNSRQPALKAVA